MSTYNFHPLAGLWFPLIDGEEYNELVTDIRTHGLIEPIVLWEGQILDGRNRYRACQEAGVAPHYREYTGTDPAGFVVSQNLHRRHLTARQRAFVHGELRAYYKAQAKERQGERNDLKLEKRTSLQFCSEVKRSTPARDWATDAAKSAGVSPRSMYQVQTILEQGVPALITAVKQGAFSMQAGAALANVADKDQQITLVKDSVARKQFLREQRQAKAQKSLRRKAPVRSPTPIDLRQDLAQDALGYLKVWWQRASEEERACFLQWVRTEDKYNAAS